MAVTDFFPIGVSFAMVSPQILTPVVSLFVEDIGPEPQLIGQLWPRGQGV